MNEATTKNNNDADVDVAKDLPDPNKVIVDVYGDVTKDTDVDVAKDIFEHNKVIVEVPLEETNGDNEDNEEQEDNGVEYSDKKDG
ncbi:hypothetical protein K7X08_000076 [Anisodus acutangulus]|uniref:Uncharacterized protein n=1 Tax=Anisodus acutangulus TaxID=402998 RepID=A0A9Q1RD61_9SOLA|nr:hypothetical protein K7X08_000076 [Anisodus acutangulus]